MENVDLTQVPNQLGTAVLKASTGAVVRATGDLASQESSVIATLYRIVQDTGGLLCGDPLKLITVSFNSYSYVVALGGGMVYIVKKQPEE
ncbi:hypothetical protein JKP88DRAFT_70829 [Tribonema minus]|uniref:Late endosomal/lysosomal adaptor and MAPK and MTOR activator 5 n=1 Tax=Tribonema minus TaxID=303371 RepID=A0A835YRW7_9STRA|nr:hypothetical protein JKP88DRAFT_70829 [Tribonema minus]